MQVMEQTGLTPQQLKSADHAQLLQLQGQLLMGTVWGVWEVAANLVADHEIVDSRRIYRIDLTVPTGMDPTCANAHAVWAELMRYAIARRSFPLRGKGTSKRPRFSTLLAEIRLLGMATRQFAQHPGPGFWTRCTADQMVLWFGGKSGASLTNKLRQLSVLGAIVDAPAGRKKPKGTAPARHRTGEPEDTQVPQLDTQYLPLPDPFTAAAGQRALYMTEQVGPTLLSALEHCATVPLRRLNKNPRTPGCGEPLGNGQQAAVKASTLDPIIARWAWQDLDGHALAALRYDVFFTQNQKGEFAWPPRTYAQAVAALMVLQGAHLFLIALADGGRHGEILSVKEGALGRSETDAPTLTSRTRKIDPNDGREHEVPLPAAVQAAVLQQERLARFLKKSQGISGQHLWVQIARKRGNSLKSFDSTLDAFVRAFRLEPLLGDSNLHMHRFRKTLARIVALALVHAPKILMEVFGHRDEQMTVMRYILSDAGLLKEIQEITRELLVLKGIWTIENLDAMQGKGAQRLRERWSQHAKLVGKSALEPQTIREFVETVFEGGQALAVIAPGILCTSFTKGGRCNEYGGGKPNPEHCSPQCEHQVACPTYESVDTFEVEDAILNALNTADYLLRQLGEAEARNEDMVVATFAGQIRSLVGRWLEIDQHVATHPLGHRFIPVHLVAP